GTITRWRQPSGPGVRVDAGYGPGMTVPQAFDSLLAKLIVTGTNRQQALERARRALAEFEVGGMPTVLPFHRAVVDDPAFTAEPFPVHPRVSEPGLRGAAPAVLRVAGPDRGRCGRRPAGPRADHGRGAGQAAGGGPAGRARPDRRSGRTPRGRPGRG